MARVTRLVFQSQFPADYVTPRPARRSILRSPPLHSCTANHCVAVSERFGVVDQVERSRFKAHFMSECCLLSRRTVQRVERTCQGHSPNPHLRCWTIPVNLPIARSSLSVLRVQAPPYPSSGFFSEPVSGVRPASSHRLSSCRGPSFSPPPFSRWASSSPISSSGLPSSWPVSF